MRKALLASVFAASLPALAQAGQISDLSALNVVGNANFNSTAVTFASPANLVTGAGDFALLGTCVGCVTIVPTLTYNPPTYGQIYTATNLGYTASFDALNLVDVSGNGTTTLGLQYTGIAHLTGFDDTPADGVFTINQFGHVIASFSGITVATPTPEPMTLALLGTGLLGLGLVRRARQQ